MTSNPQISLSHSRVRLAVDVDVRGTTVTVMLDGEEPKIEVYVNAFDAC